MDRLRARRLALDHAFAQRLAARFRPETTYRVRMVLALSESGDGATLDLGSLVSGRGARHDSIEVCLAAPPDDSSLRADVASLMALDLERQLYARECLPTIWLPAAQGGRLEEPRALAADLLTRSAASNDPGVNQHVAESRPEQADASITSG